MEIEFTLQAKEDLAYWKKINNVIVLKKIRKLLEVIIEAPFEGIGKPEPLKPTLLAVGLARLTRSTVLSMKLKQNLLLCFL